MSTQIDRTMFRKALIELGHDPHQYCGQRLSLAGMAELYGLDQEVILEAIDGKQIAAHYDYLNDTIWIEALDAAHFYYCIKNEANLYAP